MSQKLAIFALAKIPPENAHNLSISALRLNLAPKIVGFQSRKLETRVAGLQLASPVGLAAGYDKDAVVVAPLLRAGFGFIEVGTVTPHPQGGNPKPRLFRLKRDKAVINRFGFNSAGADAVARRLKDRPKSGIVGLNIGANKDSRNFVSDFIEVLMRCGQHVDFATINVSSPNTESLRDLQQKQHLGSLLDRVIQARESLSRQLPIFLKVSPDLESSEVCNVAEAALKAKIDGIIATNTTVCRKHLRTPGPYEKGGLSGRPLFNRSTQVLAQLYEATEGQTPLIGVGGIDSAKTAYQKIEAGASAIQLYTALAYKGLSLVEEISAGLEQLLDKDGFASISDVTGTRAKEFLRTQ